MRSLVARNQRAEVCVKAALFRDGRMLLLKRSPTLTAFPSTWDMPGGHVEVGETPIRALRREIREETGLTSVVGQPFWTEFFDYPIARGRSVRSIEIDFFCTTRSSALPKLDPREHSQFAWLTKYDGRTFPAASEVRAIIRRALAGHPRHQLSSQR